MPETITPRQRYVKRLQALQLERTSWDAHWRDLNDYLQPRRARFNLSDRNNGRKLNGNIINSSPLIAVRTLTAGMMAGLTSPARPWFKLTTPDPELAKYEAVKVWLAAVEERIRWAFLKSNLYNFLPNVYQDLAVFGTAAGLVESDAEDTVRGYVVPTGTYSLATSARQSVTTMYRETTRTYAQLAEDFGFQNCSKNVQEQIKRGNLDQFAEVCHVVEPNVNYESGRMGPKGMPFRSCWFERAKGADDKFLRESGYKTNPLIAVRWDTLDGDVYGRGPGMDALGDAKALQHLEKKKLTQIDKLADPPVSAPASLRHQRISMLPGDVVFTDAMANGAKVAPIHEVRADGIVATGNEIANHQQRIDRVFFADLWLMIAQSEGRMTAREVAERHEEKLLQLGPVLERLQDELLDPLVDRVFSILDDSLLLPPPPVELNGQDLRVDYISMLAQAQKLIGVQTIERTVGFALTMAKGGKPEALDKLNADKMLSAYGEDVGLKPDLLNSDEDVAELRRARQEAQQQQANLEQASLAVDGAKTLSETDVGGDNALAAIARAYGGVA